MGATGNIQDSRSSLKNIVGWYLPDASGPGHWNDPDMLQIGTGGMHHRPHDQINLAKRCWRPGGGRPEDQARAGAEGPASFSAAPGAFGAEESDASGTAGLHSTVGGHGGLGRLPAKHPGRAVRDP
ncbi:hypothetical protein [Streptomyces litchfieldiae]|uniref:Alpha-galactosidase n=1 Tax=Streptomyces litchfieldiae TaxID=3075543 RepID=A0ABU2MQG5_9ACTN|nr:hypothetical protein [Streptomyces sp. DSM 44938]MDT0343856.1 hypothetical protein [Streptomyces sp. DSM 44938]